MPCRHIDYPEAFSLWNVGSSWGAVLSFASFLLFIGIIFCTLLAGERKTRASYLPGLRTGPDGSADDVGSTIYDGCFC